MAHTPRMTRGHFVEIAKTIAGLTRQEDGRPALTAEQKAFVIGEFSDMLARTNNGFDRTLFARACNGRA